MSFLAFLSGHFLYTAGRKVPEFVFLETFIYFLIFSGFLSDGRQLPAEFTLNFDKS